ncbi:hypothetical protein [Amycolatopsis japonica]
MSHGVLPPLLSNAEVRRRTFELMDRHQQKIDDGTTASINQERAEVGRLRREVERLTAALKEATERKTWTPDLGERVKGVARNPADPNPVGAYAGRIGDTARILLPPRPDVLTDYAYVDFDTVQPVSASDGVS